MTPGTPLPSESGGEMSPGPKTSGKSWGDIMDESERPKAFVNAHAQSSPKTYFGHKFWAQDVPPRFRKKATTRNCQGFYPTTPKQGYRPWDRVGPFQKRHHDGHVGPWFGFKFRKNSENSLFMGFRPYGGSVSDSVRYGRGWKCLGTDSFRIGNRGRSD